MTTLGPRILKESTEHAHVQREQFFGMLSHEVLNLLNGTIGFADLLAESPLNSEQREYLEMIREVNGILCILLGDVLKFIRLGSETFTLQYSDVDVRDLCEDVRSLYLPQVSKKGVELRVSVESSVPQALRSDKVRLYQILFNLVGNAVKFTPRGNIIIAARCTDFSATGMGTETCLLRIEVRDSGVGIPPEQAHRLFQPYVQLNSRNASTQNGYGLGLAICHRLTELMGGEIGLTKSSSAGSTFYLLLKLECVDTSLPPSLNQDAPPPSC